MMKSIKIAFLGTALAAFMLPALAQNTADTAAGESTPDTAKQAQSTPDTAKGARRQTVNQRQWNQQKRIANGVKSGELTRGEARNLEKNEAQMHHEIGEMRADNNGKLTAADRRKLNRQQNLMSKKISKDKHNNKTR